MSAPLFAGFAFTAFAAALCFAPAREASAADNPAPIAAQGTTSDQATGIDTSRTTPPPFRFDVVVEGRKLPDEIKAQIEGTVALGKGSAGTEPTTLGQLRRRAKEEIKQLGKVLRSQAYFNGHIEPVIEEAQGGRFVLTYRVTLGPRTMIRSFRIIYPDHPADEASLPSDAMPLGLKPNRAARAQRIINLTSDALTWLENHGHPSPELVHREVIIDLASHHADITLTINAGAPRYFGALVIHNENDAQEAGSTKTDYIQGLAAFKPGDLYDRRKVDETIAALRKTGLFNQVTIDIVDGEGNKATPALALGEAKRRSVGFGARWSSDEGVGTKSFWEHRNIFGRAEKLRFELSVAQNKQAAKAEFAKPRFLRADQSLLVSSEFADEKTDAYNETSLKAGTALSRAISDQLQASLGLSFEFYRTDDSTGSHTYRQFGVPATLRYDGSDNLLDPTKGLRLNGALTPYLGSSDGSLNSFTKFEASGSTYFSFGKRPDVTFAFRGRYGLMLAQETVDVPGSLRFYAGGGGSIRGYGYQLVGPLDGANEPVGGRSVVELSSEIRYRLTKSFGVVAFLDGGNAYGTSTPKFNKPLQWGAGVGLRYYTPIGPVRADIGIPVNKRKGIDDAFQVYFSLGQAF